jgi:hypothetical protein
MKRSRGIDWPKIVMGGVVLLGGYAVYRLVRAEPEPAPSPPNPTAPWIPIPGIISPVPPSPPKPALGQIAYLGDPISLAQGKTYRAIGSLSAIEAMALGFGGDKKQTLAARFSDLGFRDVKIFDELSELPFNWPAETVTSLPDRPFMIEGVWERETASIPKPPQIVKAWEA